MSENLPPLPTLRVFEAAARHLNFTRAGEELGMTQAAVSYHIKLLEERLGATLFVRHGRKIELTDTANTLAPALSGAFRTIANAFKTAKSNVGSTLAISALPTVSTQWLARRLGAFQVSHPELAVRLEMSTALVDFDNEDIDVGIRVGMGEYPGLVSHLLFRAEYAPMLSPALAASIGGVKTPADLLKLPFVSEDELWNSQWLELVGLPCPEVVRGLNVNFGSQYLDAAAAISGAGIAMLTPALYREELKDGRLIQPFDIVGVDPVSYWLVYPHARRTLPKIRAFRDWLLAEAESLQNQTI
ncbi:MAG: LysR substrate-binding domain-containing protein [Pelagibacterium sp.]|uniref:LysR substrate-binding domain-containing protein n=1 Tax=Pelagibacterium sp. TaxID=1967288 RepID=UPI0032ECA033